MTNNPKITVLGAGAMGCLFGGLLADAGYLVVAYVGMGLVWMFSPPGEPLYRIRSCEGLGTTNIAYGGPERRTPYITGSDRGCILQCKRPTPGRLMYSQI